MPPMLKNPPAVTVSNIRVVLGEKRVEIVLSGAWVHRDLVWSGSQNHKILAARNHIRIARHVHQIGRGQRRHCTTIVIGNQRRLRMPLSGNADGHSLGHGVSQHRLQLDRVGRSEVVVRAIGWGLVDNVPAPIAPRRR
jgi:hypothetical protein